MEKSTKSEKVKEQEVVPPPLEIKKSTDPGFDLNTCMLNIPVPQTLEESSDRYFDSYSHFAIHEEMLKDKVETF